MDDVIDRLPEQPQPKAKFGDLPSLGCAPVRDTANGIVWVALRTLQMYMQDGKGDAEQCHHALRAAHDALEVLGHYVDSEYAAALAMADVDSERPIPTPMRRDMQDLGSSLILAKREITVLGKMLDECALQCKLPAMPVG